MDGDSYPENKEAGSSVIEEVGGWNGVEVVGEDEIEVEVVDEDEIEVEVVGEGVAVDLNADIQDIRKEAVYEDEVDEEDRDVYGGGLTF